MKKLYIRGGILLGTILGMPSSHAMDIAVINAMPSYIWKNTKTAYLSLSERLLAPLNMGVNAQDEDGDSRLMNAIYGRKPDKIKNYLNHPNIDVTHKNVDGDTPLITALSCNDCDTIKKLLNHPDIDINAATNTGMTPLMMTSRYCENPEITETILNRSNDINAQNQWKQTALMMFACKCEPLAHPNRKKFLKMMLAHPEIDVTIPDENGITAATLTHDEDCERLIKQKSPQFKEAKIFLLEREEKCSYASHIPDGVMENILSNVVGEEIGIDKEKYNAEKQEELIEQAKQKLTSAQRNLLERHLKHGLTPQEQAKVDDYVTQKRKAIFAPEKFRDALGKQEEMD